jgi:hypothetical protein
VDFHAPDNARKLGKQAQQTTKSAVIVIWDQQEQVFHKIMRIEVHSLKH